MIASQDPAMKKIHEHRADLDLKKRVSGLRVRIAGKSIGKGVEGISPISSRFWDAIQLLMRCAQMIAVDQISNAIFELNRVQVSPSMLSSVQESIAEVSRWNPVMAIVA